VRGKRELPSLKSVAIRLLARREHSREELRGKLQRHATEGEDIEAVLDRMVETGLQSDQRFAESYLRSKGPRLGLARLQRELLERGVKGEQLDQVLEQAPLEDEMTRARAVWVKKYGVLPQDRSDWARQARFLQSRGFPAEVIRKLLKEPFDESA
jgi:regulatory protein